MRKLLFIGGFAAIAAAAASVLALSAFYGMNTPFDDLEADDWWNHR